jgi:16S rRNA (cytidine1402-2'-O)-methyltransferase
VSVSREITKKFEETINGTLTEAVTHFENRAPKGEFVVVLEGAKYANNQIEDLDSE